MEKETFFISAGEVSKLLGISLSTAYRIIRYENKTLKKEGKIVIPGKISRKYFVEKTNI